MALQRAAPGHLRGRLALRAACAHALPEADHCVLGLAGLWCPWQDPTTLEWENTFAAPTINADEHPLLGLMQQADEERGMPVILLAGQYGALLDAPPVRSSAFMRRFRRRLWG